MVLFGNTNKSSYIYDKILKMTQEQLRMQMLAGIITEGQYKKKLDEGDNLNDKVIQAINLYDNLTDKQDIDIYDLDSDIENIVGTGNPNWYNLDNEVVDDLLVFLKSKINN